MEERRETRDERRQGRYSYLLSSLFYRHYRFLIVPLGSTVCTATRWTWTSTLLAISTDTYASLTLLIRPSTPPAVMTSSPFCRLSTMLLCSLARFICGR